MSRYKMVELGTLIQQAKTVRCEDGDYPVLSMTMHDGLVFQDDKFKKTIASKDRSDYKVVKRNQLVISFPIDEGVLAAQRIVDAGIVSPAYGIWDINQEKILPEFLEYALRCDRALSYYKAKLRGSTARRRSLPTPTLLAFTVPLPDISEQKHILEVIHKTKSLISKRTEEFKLLDNLTKARFVELFGECEEHKRLEDYALLITKGASPKWQGVDYCEEGTLFVTSENVREGYLDLSKRKYLDDRINEIQPRSILKRNDILINIVGASIGRAAVYDCDEVANINQAVALARVDFSQINQTYLMTFLNSPQAIEMYGKMKKGGARDNLSLQNIADLQIPVAPMELQNQFAAFVEQTDKSKAVVQKALYEAQTLFDSLMQEYFG